MGNRSRIEWTDATWNPVTGCSKISPGCANCYAERMAHRFGWTSLPWTRDNAGQNVRLHPERLEEPLHWRKPRMVFVCSMADLFHEQVPFDYIAAVFGVMAAAPQHTFQVLTKRPKRALEFFHWIDELASRGLGSRWERLSYCRREAVRLGVKELPDDVHADGADWPLPNVWIGVTAEDQERADERIPVLVQIPATVRFVSCEPLLGPVDLAAAGALGCTCPDTELDDGEVEERCLGTCVFYRHALDKSRRIDWVIVGGESGPGARPMHPDWVRSIRDQCQAAGVPFFFKQWGEWLPNDQEYGANPGDFDYDRPHVMVGNVAMCRAGKRHAGRRLDGRTWDEMPRVPQGEAV